MYTNIIIYIYIYVRVPAYNIKKLIIIIINNNYRHFRLPWTIWDIITIIILILLLLYYCIQLGDALYYRSWNTGAWSQQRLQSRCFTYTIIYIIISILTYLYIDVVVICGRCVKHVGVHDWPWTGHKRVTVVKYDLPLHAFPCRHRGPADSHIGRSTNTN